MSSSQGVTGVVPTDIHSDGSATNDIHRPENDDRQQAQAFLEQRGRDLHPALDPQASIHQNEPKEKDEHYPHIFKTSINNYTKEFIEAVEAYRDEWQDPRIRALSLRGKISWEQVMQEVRQAEERYQLAGKSGIRRLARKATDESPAILPYLRMLPNNTMWLPAVAGGLRLIFEAFSQISENREYILKFLVRIPDIITQTEDTCVNFGPDPALYAKAEKVYIAVLAAIEGTIKWLNKKVTGKAFTAIRLGPSYNKSFKDKLTDLDDTLKALEVHVSPIRDRLTVRTTQSVQHLEEQMENLEQLQQASKTAIEKMMEVLADTNRTAKWMRDKDVQIRRLKIRVEEFERAASALSANELYDILAVPEIHPDYDLRHILQHIDPACDESELAFKISSGEVFRQWQAEDEAPPLFIEGGPPVSCRRSTALSIVSSTLVKVNQDYPRATSIYFFCGMHDNQQDPVCGPQGMVRSLISQVLRQFDVNLEFISMLLRPLIEKLNIRALCDCLGKLVKQLPARTVLFCVIDGISFFESTVWINDTAKVIGDLRDLAYDNETGAIFKLLVTSPRRSKHIASIFEPETRLNVSSSDARRHGSQREVMLATMRTPLQQMQSRSLHREARPYSEANCLRSALPQQTADYDLSSDEELLGL